MSEFVEMGCVYCDAELKVPAVAQRTKVRCPSCTEAFFLEPDGTVAARLEGNSTTILEQPARIDPLTPPGGIPELPGRPDTRPVRGPVPLPGEDDVPSQDPRESTRKIDRRVLEERLQEAEEGRGVPEPAPRVGPVTAPVRSEVAPARAPVGLAVWALLVLPLALACAPLNSVPQVTGTLARVGQVADRGLRELNALLPVGWRLPVVPPPRKVQIRDGSSGDSDLRRSDIEGQ